MEKVVKRIKNSRVFADKLTLFLAIFIVFASLTTLKVYADGDDGKITSDLSHYDTRLSHLSELLSQSFDVLLNQAVAENDGDGHVTMSMISKYSTFETIGNYIGLAPGATQYADQDQAMAVDGGDSAPVRVLSLNDVVGYYVKQHKVATDSQGHALGYDDEGLDDAAKSPISQYIMFGNMIHSIGIDEIYDSKSSGSEMTRAIFGYIIYVLYFLAYSAGNLMKNILNFLQNLDIFRAFTMSNAEIASLGDDSITKMIANTTLATKIREFRTWLGVFRYVVLGWMIFILIAGLTVFKTRQMNKAAITTQRLRTFGYRVVVMFIGVPLMCMVYSECLALLGNFTSLETYNQSTAYVAAQFLNVEGWASADYFTMPAGDYKIHINVKTGEYETDLNGKTEPQVVSSINELVYNSEGVRTSEYAAYTKIPEPVYFNLFFNDTSDSAGKDKQTMNQLDESFMTDAKSTDTGLSGANTHTPVFNYFKNLILSYAKSDTIDPSDLYKQIYVQDLGFISDEIDTGDKSMTLSATSQAYKTLLSWDSVDEVWTQLQGSPYLLNADDYFNYRISICDQHKYDIAMLGLPGCVAINGAKGDTEYSGVIFAGNLSGDGKKFTALKRPFLKDTLSAKTVKVTSQTVGTGGGSYGVQSVTRNEKTVISSDATIRSTDASLKEVGAITMDMTFKYTSMTRGFSPLACYNFLNSSYHDSAVYVTTPEKVTNSKVSNAHYSVSTPYSGVEEFVYLAYTISVLFMFTVLGWVFGISMLMNVIVEFFKALPDILKMMVGSLNGFVHGVASVVAIVIEVLVTITLYSLSLSVVSFVLALIKAIFSTVGKMFGINLTTSSASIISMLSYAISIVGILWATFQLIKWRKAIIISLKSLVTHTLNQVFGTNAEMPTGANGGMLGAVAGAAAVGAGLHALAGEEGGLESVVNDLTGGTGGTALSEGLEDVKSDLEKGDLMGAVDDAKAAKDGLMRGENSESAAEKALDGSDMDSENFNADGLKDWQADNVELARAAGDYDAAETLAAQYRDENQRAAEKAVESKGVQNRGTSAGKYNENGLTKDQQATYEKLGGAGNAKAEEYAAQARKDNAAVDYEAGENADGVGADGLTSDERNEIEKTADEQNLTTAQMEGLADGYRQKRAAATYAAATKKAGLGKAEQAEYDKILASKGEAAADEYADGVRAEHARDDYMNGVSGDKNEMGLNAEQQETYDTIASGESTYNGASGQAAANAYATDMRTANASQAVFEAGGPAKPSYQASAYTTGGGSDSAVFRQAAENYDANGLTRAQANVVNSAVVAGASESDVIAMVDGYRQQNFGDNAETIVKQMNDVAGRKNATVSYGSTDNSSGDARLVKVGTTKSGTGQMLYQATDMNASGNGVVTTMSVSESNGQTTYQEVSSITGKAIDGGSQITVKDPSAGGFTYGDTFAGYATVQGTGNKTVVSQAMASGTQMAGFNSNATLLSKDAQVVASSGGGERVVTSQGGVNYRVVNEGGGDVVYAVAGGGAVGGMAMAAAYRGTNVIPSQGTTLDVGGGYTIQMNAAGQMPTVYRNGSAVGTNESYDVIYKNSDINFGMSDANQQKIQQTVEGQGFAGTNYAAPVQTDVRPGRTVTSGPSNRNSGTGYTEYIEYYDNGGHSTTEDYGVNSGDGMITKGTKVMRDITVAKAYTNKGKQVLNSGEEVDPNAGKDDTQTT